MKFRRWIVLAVVICLSVGLFSMGAAAAEKDISAPVISASNAEASGKVKIAWDAVDGAETYRIYRATSKNGTYTRVYTTSSTSYTNASTEAGKLYYYYVVAVAKDGSLSAASNIVSRTCDLPRPTITLTNVESTGKIKITWDAVEGAVKYKLYRSSDGESWSLLKTTTGTGITNTSAVPGKLYYYKVKAIAENTAANSAYSTTKSKHCDLARPTITSLGNSAYSGKVMINWSPVEGAVAYNVYRADSKDGTFAFLAKTTDTSYVNGSGVAGEVYYYKVKAIAQEAAANSALSTAKYRTCDLPRPALTLTNVESTGKIRISWGAVEGAVKYKLYRSTDGENWTLLKTTTGTKITNTSAVAGTTYFYRVKAIAENSGANSAYSLVKSRPCDLPRPEIREIGNVTSGKIKIAWDAMEGAVGYKVYRADSKDGTYDYLGQTTDTEFTNTSAVAGKTYYYKIKALAADAASNSALSAPKDGICKLSRPVITLSNVASTGKIKLTWEPVEGAVKYEILRSESENGTYDTIGSTANTSFTNTTAEAGKVYYYKVYAVAENSEANSADSSAKYRTCDLPRPVITEVGNQTSGKIVITWDAVAGAVGYNVYRSDSSNGTYSFLGETTSTSFTNTSAVPGKVYYYKVKALAEDSSANSAQSEAEYGMCHLSRPVIKLANVEESGNIQISWSEVEGAVAYEVYQSEDGSDWKLLESTTDTALAHTGTVAGREYFYKAMAIASDTTANSDYSLVKSRIADLPRPVVTVSNEEDTGRIRLTWSPVEGAVKYWVFRSTSSDGEYTCIKTVTEETFTDTSAEENVTYYYKVRAVAENTDANSAMSAVQQGSYQYLNELKVSVALNESGKPRLSWNKVEGAASYVVNRALSADGVYKEISEVTECFLTHNSAAFGVTNFYQVQAKDASGNVIMESTVVSFDIPLPEGETLTKQYVNDVKIAVYAYPDSTSEMTLITYMEEVQLGMEVTTSATGSWYRLFYKDQMYYVWIVPDDEKLTTQESSYSYTWENEYQQKVIELALEIASWDTYYTNDESDGIMNEDGTYGFDCSGLASYILNRVMQQYVPTYRLSKNITTLHETTDLFNLGYPGEFAAYEISMDEIKPGDVLFFSQDSDFDHCGIYLGNNEFIHSASLWNGVRIMPVSDIYLRDLVEVRRYMPAEIVPANTDRYVIANSVKLYQDRNTTSTQLYSFTKNDVVTVLFTNSDNWAYVEMNDGTRGFVLTKNLSAEPVE